MWVLLLLGCAPDLPQAILKDNRSEHFLDRPYPSDELLRSGGGVDLTDFPLPDSALGRGFVEGWARQAGETVNGFSPLGPLFFRFDGPLSLPKTLSGTADDPVRLRSLEDGSLVPIHTRFVEDPQRDPFLAPNTLVLVPTEPTPLVSGARYIAEIDTSIANPPEGESADGEVAVSTSFWVQDVVGQLVALGEATDQALDADGSILEPGVLRRVVSVSYAAGETPSGKDALVCSVEFEDGAVEHSYLEAEDGFEDFTVDLSDDPMDVWQAEIRTLSFRDSSTAPYATAGLVGFVLDSDRSDGWIDFDTDSNLLSEPVLESMRVVLQVPRDVEPSLAMTWDHGTGGHAYNAVQRSASADDFGSLREGWAQQGMVVVSRDQPLYGTRFPLIDSGYSGTLGFYNIGNLPAFRDNQRQAAVDHRVLHRFVRDVLPEELGVDAFDGIGSFGHSLGSVTAHLGLALQDGDGADAGLMSGTGGIFSYYITDTGLLTGGSGTTAGFAQDLFSLLGVSVPDEITGQNAFAALLGIPEEAWEGVDRMHPALGLFQLIMDPSDPMAVAPWLTAPETIILGVNDYQVPNITTEWLSEALVESTLVECVPAQEYDGHYCTFREPAGLGAFADFADELR